MKNVLMTFFMTLLMLAMFSVGGAAERAGPQSPLQIDTLDYTSPTPTASCDSDANSQDLVLTGLPAAVLVRDHVAIRSTANAAHPTQHAAAACDSLVVWSFGFDYQETGISGVFKRTGIHPLTTHLSMEVDNNPISFRLPATVPPR